MRKIALITGATSGIGKATASLLAKNNYNIIITGRRNNLLEDLKNEIEQKYDSEVLILNFDIRNNKEVVNAVNNIPSGWENIEVLVNNAGLAAGLNPLQSGELDNWERMIDTNVKGLLYISRLIAPLMIKNGKGHIVNIGSIAGKEVYAKGNVYCASKYAVEAISKGMRIDMLEQNIRVSNICPGMVETEFSLVRFSGDKEAAQKVYYGITPLFPEDVAEAVLFAVTRPPHVNINDILIMPTSQANSSYIYRKDSKDK